MMLVVMFYEVGTRDCQGLRLAEVVDTGWLAMDVSRSFQCGMPHNRSYHLMPSAQTVVNIWTILAYFSHLRPFDLNA